MVDLYSNYHLTYQMTSLEENIAYQISQFARNFMPTFRTNFSPFEPGKRTTGSAITGEIASTNSSNSSSDDTDSSSDEDDTTVSLSMKSSMIEQRDLMKEERNESTFPSSCKDTYGFELSDPDKESMARYKRYVNIQKRSQPSTSSAEKIDKNPKPFVLESLATYNDSYETVAEPKVTDETILKYQNYCNLLINRNYEENYSSLDMIEKYVNVTK